MVVADFSGYATKNGLKCSDGRTIMPDAFKQHDGATVPLVWQHMHDAAANVLGHAKLENRKDGVYAYGFFNDTLAGQNAKELVNHGDITALSIYANKLVQKGMDVLHGAIREVSLVLSGANPGAFIDNINLQHGDGFEVVDDEAIIYTGLTLEHASPIESGDIVADTTTRVDNTVDNTADTTDTTTDPTTDAAKTSLDKPLADIVHADTPAPGNAQEKTVQDVFDTFTEDQKNVLYFMVGQAVDDATKGDVAKQSDDTDSITTDDADNTDSTTSTDKTDSTTTNDLTHQEGDLMSRNVFENHDTDTAPKATLSHAQLDEIITDAQKTGSLKESFLAHVATYGIENIDYLFPDAKSVTLTPEVIGRRQEWVSDVVNGTKHSPFSRIKSTAVDLTADEARAKGYVKGNLKKEEIIKLLKRVTTPTTIYKKQKLDRDDIVDITDLDVVAWLKAEMRLMLDEELARAVLIGDGREIDDEDKIDEDHLRPIAYDDTMYAHQVTVQAIPVGDEIIEAVLRARTYYKGTGTPTFYTTDTILTDLILLKDTVGRRLYESEASLAAALRVSKIVTVEVMEDVPELIGIVVNIADYTLGADKGGNISMFDDFDIDYNQYKYLIETRVSGALTKPKSAVVIKRIVGTIVTPTGPSYNGTTHTITFPATTGVVYKVDGVTKTGNVVITETTDVLATPDVGYSFPHSVNTDWTFVYTP